MPYMFYNNNDNNGNDDNDDYDVDDNNNDNNNINNKLLLLLLIITLKIIITIIIHIFVIPYIQNPVCSKTPMYSDSCVGGPWELGTVLPAGAQWGGRRN